MKAASATLFFIVLYLKYNVPNNIIMVDLPKYYKQKKHAQKR